MSNTHEAEALKHTCDVCGRKFTWSKHLYRIKIDGVSTRACHFCKIIYRKPMAVAGQNHMSMAKSLERIYTPKISPTSTRREALIHTPPILEGFPFKFVPVHEDGTLYTEEQTKALTNQVDKIYDEEYKKIASEIAGKLQVEMNNDDKIKGEKIGEAYYETSEQEQKQKQQQEREKFLEDLKKNIASIPNSPIPDNTSSSQIPNPGSEEAGKLGCTCAVMDNGYGNPNRREYDGWVISADCPIHNGKFLEEEQNNINLKGGRKTHKQ